ncbi:MAG TPA: L-aspartate oxidase [Thiotrichaceae bacterium]|jgi:L-aspartate oxidase|nr:L-aspartate oxidase [Thiotrichaceae bacterium]HIM08603.1 L-aspartate oxidase [Gammaproteobacteria bacterium]
MPDQQQHDVLIIGSGAAGLSLAIKLADHANVAVLSKEALIGGATLHAQGGFSAVLDEHDSTESHFEDTLATGVGLCDPDIVRFVVESAHKSVQWLVDQGVDFTRTDEESGSNSPFHLHKEGGHSHRRIIHAADATGKAIETTLESLVRAHPNINLYEHHIAVDLITIQKLAKPDNRCLGAYVLDVINNKVNVFSARNVILATGGAGKVYLYTSNPDSCTGDGIAMAHRAGCRIANMEFIQFHPTCLYHPMAKSFLISEALRGEGAKLILANGESFMHRYDSREELASRDVVARAIDYEMKRLGHDCVYLDISHKSKEFIKQHFPTINQRCLDLGIDMSSEPIPVVPAAHYTCGGVMVDQNGQTDIPGLYAIGEVSCSGLHGANRMASNSLLECVVFAHAAFKDIRQTLSATKMPGQLPEWDESRVTDSDEEVVVSHNWDEIRRFMWDYVGIVRTTKRLQRAQHRIKLLRSEVTEYYGNFRISKDLIELRNLLVVAELIVESALKRKESRGLHYTVDYPVADTTDKAINTVINPQLSENGHVAA